MAIVSIQGIPGATRMVDQFSGRELQNRMRRAVRAGAKPFQAALKEVAASSDVPRSFQKVPAAKVSTRGGASGREITATVRPKSPLFNIFEPGAGAHDIDGNPLAGPEGSGAWDNSGRKRPARFFARGKVRHPGMKARPILPRAFAAGEGRATDAMANALFQVPE